VGCDVLRLEVIKVENHTFISKIENAFMIHYSLFDILTLKNDIGLIYLWIIMNRFIF